MSWKFSADVKGNIGIPVLSDDSNIRASGRNSLKIQVGNGSYGQWQLIWDFQKVTNLEEYDFITLYWYGRGDGTKYVVQINTGTPGKYFWYELIDNWIGWKKGNIAMHVSDGFYMLYGVSFVKITKNNATWRDIKTLVFKLSDANINIGGFFI